jgi:putative FmdB family regulatory protein
MPIYEYVCGGCGEKFERYVRAWGEAVSCPCCASPSVEKQLSRFAMAAGDSSPAGEPQPGAGGCCGGSCGCAH